MGMSHEGIHIIAVACVKQGYAGFQRICSQVTYECFVAVLVRADTVVRMFVQYHVNMVVFEVAYQLLRFQL